MIGSMVGARAGSVGGSGATFTQVSCDGSRQLAYWCRRERRIASAAIGDQGAMIHRADHSQRRGAGMGTAFATAGNVERRTVAEIWRRSGDDTRRQSACGDIAGDA
jgi:hypothetical protein